MPVLSTKKVIRTVPRGDTQVSLIVPVHNEAKAILPFLEAVSKVLSDNSLNISYEVVFVNDGSQDETERLIEQKIDEGAAIRLVNLSRNFGKEAALAAGLAHARGDVVIPMDVDLQDPPALIPEMLDRWRKGAKIVNARRTARASDSFVKRASAWTFYRLHNWLSEHPIPMDVGDFRLLDWEVVEAVQRLGERSRFNKGIFSWVGFEVSEVNFERPQRQNGATKWSWWKLWKLALDGIFSSTTTPLRIWTYVGLIMAIFSFFYTIFIFIATITDGREVPGYASTLIVILTFGGLNMIALGIIGEYVGRIYLEVRQRPLYIVRSVKGGE